MSAVQAGAIGRAPLASAPTAVARPLGRGTRTLAILALIALLLVAWEVAKWLGGDPWRIHTSLLGVPIDYEHVPPFKWRIATDLALPHV